MRGESPFCFLKLEGGSSLTVNENGELDVGTDLGIIKFTKPIAYQENNGIKEFVEVKYILENNTYGFAVGNYDRSRPLIIDPLLASTFVGGSGSETTYSIAFDRDGNVYVSGTSMSSDYPTTVGAYDRTYAYQNAVVSKFDANLGQILSSTFVSDGGYANAYAVVVDKEGSVYITGETNSSSYPTTAGAYSRIYTSGSANVFVSKFNADLSSLQASTFISRGTVSSLAVDSLGNVLIAGRTAYTSYPTTASAYDQSYNGGTSDGFITQLDTNLSSLISSTFLGGSDEDRINSLVIDSEGKIYVAGLTISNNFPAAGLTFDQTINGGSDAFISKFDSGLTNLERSTFLGGTSTDEAYSLAIGNLEEIYVAGTTSSRDFPATSGAYKKDKWYDGDVFVSKLDKNLKSLIASTFIGGSPSNEIGPIKIGINSMGNVFISGTTHAPNYPVTSGAFDTTYNGPTTAFDMFVSKFNSSLSELLASTYFGGDATDFLYSQAINRDGYIFLVGETRSTNLPTTAGAYDTIANPYDGFIAKFSPDLSAGGELSGVNAAEQIVKHDPEVEEDIEPATGAHVIEKELLTVGGARPLSFQINYNSLLLNKGVMGRGWSHNYDTRLVELSNGDIDIYLNANRVNRFFNNGNNQFSSPDLTVRFVTLVKNIDGTYSLTLQDQSVFRFNSSGKLIERKTKNGQSLNLAYNAEGKLEKIIEPISGRSLSLAYTADGLVYSVSDPLSRIVRFEYDANKDLRTIVDAKGQNIRYTYNGRGQILTQTDADGIQVLAITYDDKGRVSSKDDAVAGNQLVRYYYDETIAPSTVINTVYDRNGERRVSYHNSKYQLTKLQDELGIITNTYTYDSDGNLISDANAKGNTTRFSYDNRGNILSQTDAAGLTTKFIYDLKDNLLTVENAAYKKIINTYDNNNNLISSTDQLGNKTEFSYDNNGLLLEKISPRLGKTTYTYVYGQVYSVKDSAGNIMTYGYDTAGRQINITDGIGKTTNKTYDALDNLISITGPLGHTTTFSYDVRNNKISETDANGNLTRYNYNGNNELTSLIDAVSNQVYYEYDGEDRLKRTVDARGNTTINTYDAKGQLIGTTDQMGNTFTFEYDSIGNQIYKYDAMGRRILSITYDALNNPIALTDGLNRITYKEYDNLNRLISVTDPKGQITRYHYDDLNRIISVVDPLNGQSSQSFNQDGNRISLTDQNLNQSGFNYDLAGRLMDEVSPSRNTVSYNYDARNLVSRKINGRGQAREYFYDDEGRLIRSIDPAGTVNYSLDANGNVLTARDSIGTISRQYDSLNRLVQYTDALGNTISYQYDTVGNIVYLTYPGGKKVHYEYDLANKLIGVTDWSGRTTRYEYDPNGRLTKTLRPNGTAMTISYDIAGQILQQKDVDGNNNVISQFDFEYDAAGNVTTEKSGYSQSPFTLVNSYDENHQLKQQRILDNTGNVIEQFDYSYDAGSNLTTEQKVYGQSTVVTYTYGNRIATFNGQPVLYDADGNMIIGPLAGAMANYSYDARNRLTAVGDTSYLYDADNNRISIIETVYGNSYRSNFVINPNAALSQLLIKTDAQGNQTFYVYGLGLIGEENGGVYRTYHYDRRGSTVALTDENGTVTDHFEYGPYGELLKRSGETATPFLYNGRDGVMTDPNGLYYMRARYYNPETKRFISEDTFQGRYDDLLNINLYEYGNSNPIINIDPNGQFVPLLVGAAVLAYRVWSAYDTYQDVRGAFEDYRTGNIESLIVSWCDNSSRCCSWESRKKRNKIDQKDKNGR
ncbi:MAG: SBBP repeat-containing protein [Clostridia bacterium]|nr:SBBP repeat-containing protein [Clostridia bacterium]